MTTPLTGETWGDEVERVRAFLLAEAEQPFAVLLTRLDAARKDLLASLEGVSEAQAAYRHGSGDDEEDWGIAEALRHIASVELIMADRIRFLGLGQPVAVKATYPGFMEDVSTRQLPALRSALAASYEALLAAVREIDGRERLDTFEPHRRFGELNCRSWLVMHGLHLQDHARQIGKIKALPGYPRA